MRGACCGECTRTRRHNSKVEHPKSDHIARTDAIITSLLQLPFAVTISASRISGLRDDSVLGSSVVGHLCRGTDDSGVGGSDVAVRHGCGVL